MSLLLHLGEIVLVFLSGLGAARAAIRARLERLLDECEHADG